jgi:hypothetical protein
MSFGPRKHIKIKSSFSSNPDSLRLQSAAARATDGGARCIRARTEINYFSILHENISGASRHFMAASFLDSSHEGRGRNI